MKSVPLLVVCLNIFSLFSPSWGNPQSWNNQRVPATGLTPRQKWIIRNTWGVVRRDPLGSGKAIMLHFLTQNPGYQQQFSTFRHVRIADLPYNPNFQRLCVAIINSLSSVIDSLDNPNVMVNNLVALGRDHIRLGVTKQQYITLKFSMIAILSRTLGRQWNPEVSNTWNQALDTINGIIFRAYN